MKYAIGSCELEAESRYLTLRLRESTELRDEPQALGDRLAEDGYLVLRGFHDRSAVLEVRESILARLALGGALDPGVPRSRGVVNPELAGPATYSARDTAGLRTDELKALVYAPVVLSFFEALFAAPAASYQFQWVRAVGPGACTPVHCDAPFMSRGSDRLLTCWTPLDDIEPELGPLTICEGSHRWQSVIDTYGRSDVDRDSTTGTFSEDPAELVDTFGGRWATSSFEAGDIVILPMYTIHASLKNATGRFRLSCDTRYQPRSEPMDERWAGEKPPGHEQLWNPHAKLEPVSASRRRWGI